MSNPPKHRESHTSSTPLSSSLRPRNRRLPTDDVDSSGAEDGTSRGPSPSPDPSRTASPLPSASIPRSASGRPAPRSTPSSASLNVPTAKDSLAAIEGWWGNSWSAIQGAASNVLGSNMLEATKDKPATQRRKRPSETHRRRTSSTPPSNWGPAAEIKDKDIGVTSKERENMVRAKKREDLLSANGQMYPDAVGRFKRRNSDERQSSSAPPAESDDRDALVYIHKVKPSDTIAGLTIKYNCQVAILRKANRMWPSDTIQIRKQLMIPVDSCGIKGKMVPEPQSETADLIGESSETNSGLSNGWHGKKDSADDRPLSSAVSTVSTNAEEKPWKHDSWVILGNDTDPTEIARLPRRNLGFFPAARRKSLTFSDATPSASLDLSRTTTGVSAADSPLASPGMSASGSRLDLPSSARTSPGGSRHKRRQDSITTTNPHFLPFTGPGGVGTFKKNARKPGPANDGLNKIFGPHLPNLRPPPGQETSGWFGGGWNPLQLDPDTGVIPSNAAQVQQGGSGGIDIDFDKAAGAIEGWARNMWSKAQTAMKEQGGPTGATGGGPKRTTTRNTVPTGYGEDVSDLIEMTDSHFDIGDDPDDDELGRGRQTLQAPSRDTTSSSKTRKGD